MTDIVLTTFNARYAHASFGLRYLLANLRDGTRERARIVEFETTTDVARAVQTVLSHNPRVVGVGVYIWNAIQSLAFVRAIKQARPDVIVVIGGPEVSYEVDRQEICSLADYVITGEADLGFAELCESLLNNRRPLMRVIAAELPEFSRLALPYDLYNDDDVAHRVIYVEASRGCPFKCEFCLSSLDVPVRNAPLDSFLGAMQRLLDRGVRQFKFVDRTFNLNLNIGRAILSFFLERYSPGLFLHFELIPDRLPAALKELIERFPAGALQFEVGIQTFNEDVSALISRRQDNAKVEENLKWLRADTGVHVHTDLIVGLPGEDLESFGRGFDRLVSLRPQEIQVGMLKRLRGTPIVRHDQAWGMVYDSSPPYEIIETKLVDRDAMLRMKRFSRFWDLIANSGNFIETTPLAWRGETASSRGAFASFLALSEWIYARLGRTHSIPLVELAECVFDFLCHEMALDRSEVAHAIWRDYSRGANRDVPKFLRPFIAAAPSRRERLGATPSNLPARQARHIVARQPQD